ncbi:MAG: hypothetical protein GDA46_05285 [Bdellovibrionales bacterium]|nr:hypothetical protein [Bdellovibrionales bacterium]
MNQIFEKSFYSLLFFILFTNIEFFVKTSYFPTYVMFAWPLNLFIPLNEISLKTLNIFHFCLLIISMLFCLSSSAFNKKIINFLSCSFFLMMISIHLSYGTIFHNHHVWLYATCLMCFFSSKSPLNSKYNKFLIRLIQSLILSTYFISGIWKIRKVFSKHSLTDIASEQIAYSIGESYYSNIILELFGLTYGVKIFGMGLFFVILFQLSCILPILVGRYFILYGFLAILFHIATVIALDVIWSYGVLALIFFLIITELMLNKENIKFPRKLKSIVE